MKRLSSWLVLSTALTLAVRSASSLYWDADGAAAGNSAAGAGTNIGGSGAWNTSSTNWWSGSSPNVAWSNTNADTAIFAGPAGTVTLTEPITAGRLVFNTNGYTITGNSLQLAGPANIEVSKLGQRATIDSAISGTAGLTKSGNGVLALTNASNAYTGDTVINSGVVVVTNPAQLGTSGTTVSVNGSSTSGLSNFSQGGGSLFLDGGMAGMTFDRDISIAGRGPGPIGAAFISGGNNLITGDLTTSALVENRLVSSYGTTTINGQVTLGTGQNNIFLGNGNWIINGLVTSTGTSTGLLYKTNNSVTTTLVLNNPNNDFQQQVRIDGGTVRVANGGALGSNVSTATVRGNGGILEVRAAEANVGTFSGISVNTADGSLTVFLDRAVGDYNGALNQTVQFGEFRFGSSSRTLTFTGRNGYNLTLGLSDPAASLQGNGGANIALASTADGTLSLQGTAQVGDSSAVRNFTITATGNIVYSGRVNSNGTGFDHTFTKGGSGELTLSQGVDFFVTNGSSNYTGTTSISDGTLNLRTIRAINEAGGQLALSNGAINFIGDVGTGNGEEWTKVINLNSTQPIILANQAGSALTISSEFVASNTSAKTLYLGGENTTNNTISGIIVNNAAAAATGIQKNGNGTWVLSGANGSDANGFTGTVTVGGGTLKVMDTFAGGSRNVINDGSGLTFNIDTLTRNGYAGGGV